MKNQENKPAKTLSHSTKVQKCMEQLNQGLYERIAIIRICMLALISGEHIFMLGAPGVAKSLLAERLTKIISKAKLFSRLMTKFTQAEDIYGPISAMKLKEDKFERQTKNYLPDSEVIFLDEIWKSNANILNTLLTAINERKYYNGTLDPKIPLHTMICASNELPAQGQSLEALYDRLMIRVLVENIKSPDLKKEMLKSGNKEWKMNNEWQLSMEEIKDINSLAEMVSVPNEILDLLIHLTSELFSHDKSPIQISDRRLKKTVKLLQISAYLSGRDFVNINDCQILPHCLWEKPEQKQIIEEKMKLIIKNKIYCSKEEIESIGNDCQAVIKMMKDTKQAKMNNSMISNENGRLKNKINMAINNIKKLDDERLKQNGNSIFFETTLNELANADLFKQRTELMNLKEILESAFQDFKKLVDELKTAA